MPVATLQNIPTTEGEMARFSFAHNDHHLRMNAAIKETYGIALPDFVLNPVDLKNPGNWVDQHQQAHRNIDAIIGVGGFDLSATDWKSEADLAAWIYLNFQNHYDEAQVLNIW